MRDEAVEKKIKLLQAKARLNGSAIVQFIDASTKVSADKIGIIRMEGDDFTYHVEFLKFTKRMAIKKETFIYYLKHQEYVDFNNTL
jgi:hypothetical protein